MKSIVVVPFSRSCVPNEGPLMENDMTTTSMFNFARLCLPLLLAAACGSEAGTEYRGIPLLQVSGSVRIENDSAPPDLVPALAFYTPGGLKVQRVDVRGEFPARFTLSVFEPPPPEAIQGRGGEPPGALAYVTAVPKDHDTLIPVSGPGYSDGPFCDGEPHDKVSEWCTADRTTCYREVLSCSCPPQLPRQPRVVETCTPVEASGDPTIKDPWSTFGGVSENVLIAYIPEESLDAANAGAIWRALAGGKPYRAGYNVLVGTPPTVEEVEGKAQCKKDLEAELWARYNASNGTGYAPDSEVEDDGYQIAKDWVEADFRELLDGGYCRAPWHLTITDPATTSIDILISTQLQPIL